MLSITGFICSLLATWEFIFTYETDAPLVLGIADPDLFCIVSFSTDFKMEVLQGWSMVTFSVGCTLPTKATSLLNTN